MKCRYQAVYVAHSLGLGADAELALLEDPARGSSATLTTNADDLLRVAERGSALATLLLQGLLGRSQDGTPEERLAREANAIAVERRRRAGGSPLLVVTVDIEVEPKLTGTNRSFQDFELYFDAVDKEAIRERARPILDTILGGLIAIVDAPPAFNRLGEYVYLIPAPERVLYSLSFSGNGARLTVGRRLDQAQATNIRQFLKSKKLARQGDTIFSLLRAAVDSQAEPLRAFVAAWTALEMFTNKNFKEYEKQLFEEVTASQVEAMQSYSLQMRKVVESKHSLVNKFRVIALMLDRSNAISDTELFEKLKEARNSLLHDKSNAALPTYETVQLVRKYLRLHLSDNNPKVNKAQPATGGESQHQQ